MKSPFAATLALCCALAAGGCATAPPLPAAPPPAALFDDRAFAPPSAPVPTQAELFALTPAMRAYLDRDVRHRIRQRGPMSGLAVALFDRSGLMLEYDSAYTRTPAQAFEARAGNCLSLVMMTGVFARELGLRLEYRSALNYSSWGRQGDLLVHSGHVNVTLGRRALDGGGDLPGASVTIDFLPGDELRGLRTTEIGEATVAAMYYNNRAAELLAENRVADAYWHARAAVRADPGFATAVNTLGLIHLRSGRAAVAESAFRHALAADADDARALGNLAAALDVLGRPADAAGVRARLARIEPEPPYHWFRQGVAAAQRGEWIAARELFQREVRRDEYNAEFRHWLAVAYSALGDDKAARGELEQAVQSAPTRADRERYAAKLARLAAIGKSPTAVR